MDIEIDNSGVRLSFEQCSMHIIVKYFNLCLSLAILCESTLIFGA